jgi:hypothetical protein
MALNLYNERFTDAQVFLRKQLRTHTGARPYSCGEPGCLKTFARPDQLARHCLSVHQKKVNGGSAVQGRSRGGSAEDGLGHGEVVVQDGSGGGDGGSRAKLEMIPARA